MPSDRLAKLVEEARALTPEEQRMLRNLLDIWLENHGRQLTKEEEFELLLLKEGVISRIPPPLTEADLERHRNWKPVEIEGEPLSATIIKERR